MNATTRKDFSIIKKAINAVTSPRATGSKQSVASAIRCIESMLDVIRQSEGISDDHDGRDPEATCWSCGGPSVLVEVTCSSSLYRCASSCSTASIVR